MAHAHVLCVDDEASIRNMLSDCVSGLGLHSIAAASGEQAIEFLDSGDVDLLITDIRLGGMSGWDVAERARAKSPSLPVIYISGYPSKGQAVPGSIYLSKPFRPHEIESAILGFLAAARAGTPANDSAIDQS